VTLPAVDTWDVRGIDGPAYKVGPRCANPGCNRIAEHAHHIVRRSALGGDYRWIMLYGKPRGNLTGLCAFCHDDVTGRVGGHRAAIRHASADDLFWWCDVRDGIEGEIEYVKLAPLEPQPPTPDSLEARDPGTPEGSEECPFCGHTTRRRRSAPTETPGRRRPRKTWRVAVPDENVEQGADVLDTLVEEIGMLLGVGQDAGARYYTLVPSMTYCLQDGQRFVDAIKGRGG
jgi:hypothetical protein